LVKGIHKLVDRWAKCVAKQGSMSKNKTQTISISTLEIARGRAVVEALRYKPVLCDIQGNSLVFILSILLCLL
jgi:hypothetical protein